MDCLKDCVYTRVSVSEQKIRILRLQCILIGKSSIYDLQQFLIFFKSKKLC
jgi:hypothetical protein